MENEYLSQLDRKIALLEKELQEKREEKALILSCSIPVTVGERLKKARLMQSLSVPQLGARTGILCSDITALEEGRSQNNTMLKKIAEVLGISYKYLKEGEYISNKEQEAFDIYNKAYIDISEAAVKDLKWDLDAPATPKAIHALEREGLITVEDVVSKPPKELMKIRSFGASCFEKLKDALVRSNIPLKGEWSVCL